MYDIYSDTYEDYLMHHGVKGMKWGVRKKASRFKRYTERRTGVTKNHIKDIQYARNQTSGLRRRHYDNNLVSISKKHQKAYKDQTGKIRRAVDFMTGGKAYINRQLAAHPDMNINTATVKGYTDLGKNMIKGSLINIGTSTIGSVVGYAVASKLSKSDGFEREVKRSIGSKVGSGVGTLAGAVINRNLYKKQTLKEFE